MGRRKVGSGVVMSPLETLVWKYVDPVVKAAGFRESPAGFYLEGMGGDRVILTFYPCEYEEGTSLQVDVATVPRAYWDWVMRREADDAEPDTGGAVGKLDIHAPAELTYRFEFDDEDDDDEDYGGYDPGDYRWTISEEGDAHRCGAALVPLLEERYIPLMRSLLDRETQLRMLLDDDSELRRMDSEASSALFLKIDDASPAELEALLVEVVASGPPNVAEMAAWARRRVADRH